MKISILLKVIVSSVLVATAIIFERSETGCILTSEPISRWANSPTESPEVEVNVSSILLDYMFAPLDEESSLLRRAVWVPMETEVLATTSSDLSSRGDCPETTFLELPADDLFSSSEFAFEVPEHAVVFDLGAGVGRVTALAVLKFGATRGFGVELLPSRVSAGCMALERLYSAFVADGTIFGGGGSILEVPPEVSSAGSTWLSARSYQLALELRVGHAESYDLSTATRVLAFGTCFPMSVVHALQQNVISTLPHGSKIFFIGPKYNLWANHATKGHRKLTRLQEVNDSTLIGSHVWIMELS